MSGGHFDYSQYNIISIIESIQSEIDQNKLNPIYSDETINEFKNAIRVLNIAYVYAQRIDWLISADDGEETFHERLSEELAKAYQ